MGDRSHGRAQPRTSAATDNTDNTDYWGLATVNTDNTDVGQATDHAENIDTEGRSGAVARSAPEQPMCHPLMRSPCRGGSLHGIYTAEIDRKLAVDRLKALA
jgi:hypothetical protein